NLLGSGVNALGSGFIHNHETIHEFTEELDVVTVRNVRFNLMANGCAVGGDAESQVKCEVYFTYEKVTAELYAKLLGIS
ncbi:unnamed protein product, partial [marine sediment metagenome]